MLLNQSCSQDELDTRVFHEVYLEDINPSHGPNQELKHSSAPATYRLGLY